jgi:hypothetical protein
MTHLTSQKVASIDDHAARYWKHRLWNRQTTNRKGAQQWSPARWSIALRAYNGAGDVWSCSTNSIERRRIPQIPIISISFKPILEACWICMPKIKLGTISPHAIMPKRRPAYEAFGASIWGCTAYIVPRKWFKPGLKSFSCDPGRKLRYFRVYPGHILRK